MTGPLFWCIRCRLMTRDVLEADHHEREVHIEIRKIGSLP